MDVPYMRPDGVRAPKHPLHGARRACAGATLQRCSDGPMKLFDDTKRADTSPALFSESSYQFVNRVAGAPWDKRRALLEAWFVEHPANATRDLYNRFTDIDDSQHLGAWWELYIASLFRLLGYDVAAHPTVEGSKRQPDFLMSRGNTSFYVECTVASPGDGAGTRGTPEWIYDCGDRAAVAVLRHRPRLLHVQFLRTMSTPNGLCPLRFLHPEGLQQSATVGGQGKPPAHAGQRTAHRRRTSGSRRRAGRP